MENRPDFNADISKRIKACEEAIEYNVEGQFYQSQMFKDLRDGKKAQFDRIRNHYDLASAFCSGKQTARFGFLSCSKLHYKIKEQCFNIFFEHFPDGVQTSLIGYPQNSILDLTTF